MTDIQNVTLLIALEQAGTAGMARDGGDDCVCARIGSADRLTPSFLNLLLVLHGRAVCHSGRERTELEAGHACVWGSGSGAVFEACGGENRCLLLGVGSCRTRERLYPLLPSEGRAARFLRGLLHAQQHGIQLQAADMTPTPAFSAWLWSAAEELRAPAPQGNNQLELCLALALQQLFRALPGPVGRDEARGSRSLSLEELQQYICDHCMELRLADMAAYFHYHPNYFSVLIKKQFGLPYKALVHKIRLDCAKNLLEKPELPISEIAQRVGYRNTDYFYRQFRLGFDVTPAQYRARLLAGAQTGNTPQPQTPPIQNAAPAPPDTPD